MGTMEGKNMTTITIIFLFKFSVTFFFPPESHHSKLPSHRLAPVGLSGGGLTWRLSKTILIIYIKQNQKRQFSNN